MMKKFAVGLLSAAIILGSAAGAYAQSLTPLQLQALKVCKGVILLKDQGASCSIALAALPPGAFAAIAAQLKAGAGAQVALLNGAITSSGVSTASVGGAGGGTTTTPGGGLAGGAPGASNSNGNPGSTPAVPS